MRPICHAILVTTGAILFAGCLSPVGPDYVAPEFEVEAHWTQSNTKPQDQVAGSLFEWWKQLEDPVLNDLQNRASTGNLDMAAALTRIKTSRALYGVVTGQHLPSIRPNASMAYSRSSEELTGFPAENVDSYAVGLEASWEIDLFGRIRRTQEVASAQIEQAIADFYGVQVALAADLATAYVELRTLQERVEIAQQNAKAQAETLRLVKIRFDAEDVSGLDVAQAEANLATTMAFVPSLKAQIAANIHRISVLLGKTPNELRANLEAKAPFPKIPALIKLGIPAEVLRRRPDIRSAERALAAQTAQIGVATSDLYPSLSLTGMIGLEALDPENLFRSDALTFGIGPSLSWNIFAGGSIRSQIIAEEERAHEALITWKNQVLLALEEVETSLAAFEFEKTRRQSLQTASNAFRRAVEFARDLYVGGETGFQELLDAERNRLSAEDSLAQSRGAILIQAIQVFRSLGGGWNNTTSINQSDTTP